MLCRRRSPQLSLRAKPGPAADSKQIIGVSNRIGVNAERMAALPVDLRHVWASTGGRTLAGDSGHCDAIASTTAPSQARSHPLRFPFHKTL